MEHQLSGTSQIQPLIGMFSMAILAKNLKPNIQFGQPLTTLDWYNHEISVQPKNQSQSLEIHSPNPRQQPHGFTV